MAERVSPSDDLIKFAITEEYGERCSTFDQDCYTCRAWSQFDRLSAQQREPVVKQLDWIERKGVTGTFDANTSIGHYIATTTDDNRGMWFIVGQTTGEYMQPDLDAVRAAAQADYEQRIMAAIEIAPLSDRQPLPGQKQISETGKELLKNTEQPMNNADVSVGELAGFFVTEFPHLLTMLTQIEVARALLARYRIGRR